jgi:uncharacterized protein (TIGR03089 family)
MTLDRLLAGLPDPARPFLTYYDDGTGERVELSGVTTANWVAKTSNFLVDDLEAEPGTRVRLGVPSHWLRFVWMLSCWSVGAAVVEADADIGLSGPELVADEPVRVAASLRPLGGRFPTPPAGFLDIGAEVPAHGDVFVPIDPPGPDTLAVDVEGRRATQAELISATDPSDARLLVVPGPLDRDVDLLVAAGLGSGSLVVVANASEETIGRLAEQERAQIG